LFFAREQRLISSAFDPHDPALCHELRVNPEKYCIEVY
jgi:hypothetical protein